MKDMDKRFFAFAFLLTVSFMAVQNWMATPQSPPLKQEEVAKATLPLVDLYEKPHSEKPLLSAFRHNDLFFTSPSSDEMLYFEGNPVYPIASDNKHFSLYSLQKNPKEVLPTFYSDIKYVSLSEAKNAFVLEEERELQGSKSYLGLAQVNDSFLPIGIWDTASKKMRFLSDITETAPHFFMERVALSSSQGNEEYYVIENEYQQLVFSSKGGSLVEINLPLSTHNPKSIVRPTEIDREIRKDAPQDDYFPQFSAYQFEQGKKSYSPGKLGGYYPLLRRAILNGKKEVVHAVSPENYSLAIIGDGAEDLQYRISSYSENSIQLQASQSQRRITKTYYFPDKNAPYCFYLTVKVDGDASNVWLSSGVPEVELISGSYTPELKTRITQKNKGEVERLSLPKTTNTTSLVKPDWIANSNGYFVLLMDPLDPIPNGYQTTKVDGKNTPTRLSLVDAKYNRYPIEKYPGYKALLPLQSGKELTFRIYAGPLDKNTLTTVDTIFSNAETKYNPDYVGAWSFHGWFSFISEPFSKFLFWLMEIFYQITHSWGFSIILLTLALRIMMYPLTAWSLKSTTRMKEIEPQVKAIQERYKKDPKKVQMELMKLYREKGANPFMGCFPMLIQLPFLIGMFDLLKSSFALRGASFIPGWIDNLSAPDVLFQWDYSLFFIGNQFHLLPILLGLATYLQQKMMTPKPDPTKPLSDKEKQQASTGKIMAIVFTALFYNFPSGLNLYWFSSTILGILQQKFTKTKVSSKR